MDNRIEKLESLWIEWESGSLDASGREQLMDLLREDKEAQAHFVQLQMLTAAMHLEADTGLAPQLPGPASKSEPATLRSSNPPRKMLRTGFWMALAAILVVVLSSSWLLYLSNPNRRPGKPELAQQDSPKADNTVQEPTSHGLALITRLVDVSWQSGQRPLTIGEALPSGRFAISAGLAQVEFFCGATVVIEGPAELELVSADRARVVSGRLRAQVPPAARGFALEVDGLEIIDLGTEFGLSADPDETTVQVFDGEVELNHASDPARLLTTGQALTRTAAGVFQATTPQPEQFVDIATLQSRAQLQEANRFQSWERWSSHLERDPRVVAYYTFDRAEDGQRRLVCRTQPRRPELDGAIVGANEVQGRWNSKGGLEFKQPGDRVRVQIPGEYQSLTLASWVKVDSLDRLFNSLFLTDGYDQGEPHWQILDDGRLYFSVRPVERGQAGPVDYKALSPPFWNPDLNGKWIHLAVTCDIENRVITHYLNGEILSTHRVPREQMPARTRIGMASIGNWALPTLPDAEFAIRNLNGSIDEFVIFSDSLSSAEIKDIYENGNPY